MEMRAQVDKKSKLGGQDAAKQEIWADSLKMRDRPSINSVSDVDSQNWPN